jgi:hypothetical protein
MFERFTDHARRVVVLAQEEARLLQHNYIGTEHILLGLIHEGDGVAAEALANSHVDLASARVAVVKSVGRGDGNPSGHIPFTPRAKKGLEYSLREALALGHKEIDTGHILLGLLREGTGRGVQVLVERGVDLGVLREQIVALLALDSEPERPRRRRRFGRRGRPEPAQADACAFCGRDLYAVERAVTNHEGVFICNECAAAAVQTMAEADEPDAPSRALSLPPRVFGDVPDDRAVQQIVALFSAWSTNAFDVSFLDRVEDGARLAGVQAELRNLHGAQPSPNLFDVDRMRFVSGTEAAVRFRMTLLPHQTFDGRARRTAEGWKISRDTYCAIARLGGVACADDEWDDDAS